MAAMTDRARAAVVILAFRVLVITGLLETQRASPVCEEEIAPPV
jgi:hypothetical protein